MNAHRLAALLPRWSPDAAMRALRATIVVPGLFALTFLVIGNGQLALFSVFGSFATLVMASFGGSRRVKAIAHLGLALAGSVVLVIGTLVSGTIWLAAVVTIPVAFAVFFAGIAGPNGASGITAVLLAYVLPVASTGGLATIPDRLAGWWLASGVGTAAVLLLSRRSAGDVLRAATAGLAAALARHLTAAAAGRAEPADRDATVAAKQEMMRLFRAAPYRPTGLATADQGMGSLVVLLDWCTALTCDALGGHLDVREAAPADRELLGVAGGALADVSALLRGGGPGGIEASLARLEAARAASADFQQQLTGASESDRACAVHAVHAQTIALAAQVAAADALIAAGQADPGTVNAERRRWTGERVGRVPLPRRMPVLASALGVALPQASLRSVVFRNAARGAVALAVAVAVADLSGVQHGFWVVLGTLSVLRGNAAATGSTALRALAGTVAGFAVGAALLLGIGTSPVVLWAVLPVAVLIAAYAPGTAPFLVGQAAFTVTVVVLFNLLVPAGWRVGLLRIEDVAIGCAVSLVAGALFWPHGASGVVGHDLSDAFRRGAAYLTQAVDWALGGRPVASASTVAAVSAGIRLDEALRGYLAEQGAKRIVRDDLWQLVAATTRLRLTAYSLATLPAPDGEAAHDRGAASDREAASDGEAASEGSAATADEAGREGSAATTDEAERDGLRHVAADLAGFYTRVAAMVGTPAPDRPAPDGPAPLAVPALRFPGVPAAPPCADDGPTHETPRLLWVSDHLHHLGDHAQGISGPATRLAQQRRARWWI